MDNKYDLQQRETDCIHGIPQGMSCPQCPKSDSTRKYELSVLLRNTVNDIINIRIKETDCTGLDARKDVLKMLDSLQKLTQEQINESIYREKRYAKDSI